tara:strand:- start:485 stop:661 length:177 start_codon:yes stop_codon:yes gene_type:complete
VYLLNEGFQRTGIGQAGYAGESLLAVIPGCEEAGLAGRKGARHAITNISIFKILISQS